MRYITIVLREYYSPVNIQVAADAGWGLLSGSGFPVALMRMSRNESWGRNRCHPREVLTKSGQVIEREVGRSLSEKHKVAKRPLGHRSTQGSA